jgi:two-component system, OmpR family, sensor histidine kinase QseC
LIAQRHPSLSRRLLVGLVLVSVAYWSVIAVLTVRDSVDNVYELFDAHLAQTALALLRVTDPDERDQTMFPARMAASPALTEIFSPWPELPERLAKAGAGTTPVVTGSIHALSGDYERHLRYQVWSGDGNLLLRSANAPATVMTSLDGYSEARDTEGRVWRHFGVWDRHRDFRIVVSEANDLRNRLIRNIALQTASPLALGLPVLMILLWLSITRGLDPLGVLTREIELREPDNLRPLEAGSAPREVRPMVTALNRLLQRVTHALEGERRFTANAAHELRTPLAAIQAQLHATRAAEDEQERRRSLSQLQRGVERSIRLVGQMLTMARLDPDQALQDVADVNLRDVAESVCAELAPLALLREQALTLDVESDVPLATGNSDMLSMLLSNLVDNAIRYTEPGGHVDVRVRSDAAGAVIEVHDDGPGIAPAQRERVFERFYRIAGVEPAGTGLGLAICRRIAELHHARITLSDGRNGRGVVATVRLAAKQTGGAASSG